MLPYDDDTWARQHVARSGGLSDNPLLLIQTQPSEQWPTLVSCVRRDAKKIQSSVRAKPVCRNPTGEREYQPPPSDLSRGIGKFEYERLLSRSQGVVMLLKSKLRVVQAFSHIFSLLSSLLLCHFHSLILSLSLCRQNYPEVQHHKKNPRVL